MSPRSILRLRKGHAHPERRDEVVVEVVRDGEIVATVYGSREGLHVVSHRLGADSPDPFRLLVPPRPPGVVIPLLALGEPCPWCADTGSVDLGTGPARCPVCTRKKEEPGEGNGTLPGL